MDLGCGTGEWINAILAEHTEVVAYGMDISPIMMHNIGARFLYGEIPRDLTEFKSGIIDLVQSRYTKYTQPVEVRDINLGIRKEQWSQYLNGVFRLLAPGGWIQFIEYSIAPFCSDDSVPNDAPIFRVSDIAMPYPNIL